MGTQQSTTLNSDSTGKATSGNYGNLGDGTSDWFNYVRAKDGGIAGIGTTTDAAATVGANGSLIAILKGLRDLHKAEDAATASGDYGIPSLGARNDSLTTLTSVSGDYGLMALGPAGEVYMVPTPPLTATPAAAVALSEAATTALAASLVIKASAGTLYGLTCYNNNAAVRYLQIANLTSLGADGTVPAWVYAVPPTSSIHLEFNGSFGRRFSTGITACFSTTLATKTIAAADMWLNASYK